MEKDLLEKARDGNEEAFKELILSLKNDFYKIAKSRLNNEEDIQDVIQNTMIIAYKNIKHLRSTLSFKIWIMRILINECNKIYKKNKKNNKIIEKEMIKHTDLDVDFFTEDINNKISFSNRLKILKQAEQNIIILFYGNQYSCPEISKILHMNENTVRSKLRRAKKKLEESYLKGE